MVFTLSLTQISMRENSDIAFDIHDDTDSDLSRERFLGSLVGLSPDQSQLNPRVPNEAAGIALSSTLDPYDDHSPSIEAESLSKESAETASESLAGEESVDHSEPEIRDVTGEKTEVVQESEKSIEDTGVGETPEILSLSCPDCAGPLELPRQYLGVNGACVWCQAPIVALASDDGSVQVHLRAMEPMEPIAKPENVESELISEPQSEIILGNDGKAESEPSAQVSGGQFSPWGNPVGGSTSDEEPLSAPQPAPSKAVDADAAADADLIHAAPCSLESFDPVEVDEIGEESECTRSGTEAHDSLATSSLQLVDAPAAMDWSPPLIPSTSPEETSESSNESIMEPSMSWSGISTPTPWGPPTPPDRELSSISGRDTYDDVPAALSAGFEPHSNSSESKEDSEDLNFSSIGGADLLDDGIQAAYSDATLKTVESTSEFGFPAGLDSGFSIELGTRPDGQGALKNSDFINEWVPADTAPSESLSSSLWSKSDPDEAPQTLAMDAPLREQVLKPISSDEDAPSSTTSFFGFSDFSSSPANPSPAVEQAERFPSDPWKIEPSSDPEPEANFPPLTPPSSDPNSSLPTQSEGVESRERNSEKPLIPWPATGSATTSERKGFRKSFVVIAVIVVGFCVGTALSTYLLPTKDYIASAKAYLVHQLSPAPAIPVMPEIPLTTETAP